MAEEQEKFNELVKIAEKYIEEKALKVLNAKRKSDDKEYKDVENCYELISCKYKPMYEIDSNGNLKDPNSEKSKYWIQTIDLKEKLLVRFCIQLQNYQAMPKAINYASSNTKNENNEVDVNSSNEIFDIAKKYLKKQKAECTAIYDEFKKIKNFEEKAGNRQFNKKEEENLRKKFNKNEKYIYNHAWLKYSEGLADAIKFLIENKDDDLKNLIQDVNNFFQKKGTITDFSEKIIQKFNTNLSKEFYQKIKYISTTLSYDFFKEIGCRNLLKDDVHIVAIYEHVFGNKEDDDQKHKKLVADMLNFCKSYKNINGNPNKDTYYIDKILWLCCTGAFYEDDIIITSMNRNDFLKRIPKYNENE